MLQFGVRDNDDLKVRGPRDQRYLALVSRHDSVVSGGSCLERRTLSACLSRNSLATRPTPAQKLPPIVSPGQTRNPPPLPAVAWLKVNRGRTKKPLRAWNW